MPWYVPLLVPLGFLAFGILFVAVSDVGDWLARRRDKT